MINLKNQKKYNVDFVVVQDEGVTPILGSKAAQQMGMIKVHHENIAHVAPPMQTVKSAEQLITEFADVFEGTGCLENKYHLDVDSTVNPVVHPRRRVPIALKQKLKGELDKLTETQIVKPVDTPTPWVSSLIKPHKLRICLDPKDLNEALNRSHYPMKTIDDILPDLNNAKVFSILDAKNGFWHVELEEESSYLTTFNTSFGRYKWLRMPFGISQRQRNSNDDKTKL